MKKSLIFYYEWLPLIDSLPDASRLKFYDIISHSELRETKIDDPHLKAVVDFILLKVAENEQKYEKVVEIRKEAGAKGGKQKIANASTSKQEQASLPDNENVNDNDNANENKNEVKATHLKDFFNSLPETEGKKILDFMPECFENVWIDKQGANTEQMWRQWTKFLEHYCDPTKNHRPSLDCKKPKHKDWVGTWRNWIT